MLGIGLIPGDPSRSISGVVTVRPPFYWGFGEIVSPIPTPNGPGLVNT
jgi:hypothetical protein